MDNKIEVIAEIGSNWVFRDGSDSIGNALHCIDIASQSGATAVKFQLFKHDWFWNRGPYPQWEKYELDPDGICVLARYAYYLGLQFIVSCFALSFYRDAVYFIDSYKIASSEVGAPYLWEFRHYKPVIISTGYLLNGKISQQRFLDTISLFRGNNTTILHCIADYPADTGKVLSTWDQAKELYRDCSTRIGFSDHTKDMIAAKALLQDGCTVFEKHLRLPESDSPDCGDFSFLPEQFAEYSEMLKNG